MNTNLRPKIIGCLAGGFALWVAIASLSAQQTDIEKSAKRLRFRSGWVLCAEVAPVNDEQPLVLANVDPNEPEPDLKAAAGYAVVTVRLDPGRSFGIYDFVLEDGVGRPYPCMALRIDDKEYDAGAWQLEKTSPDQRYSLLFQVPLRPGATLEYKLKFTLFGEDTEAPNLAFRPVDSTDQFTPPAAILDEGTLGVDPVPKEEPPVVAEGETVPGPTPATATESPVPAPDPAVADAPATVPAAPTDPDAPPPPPKKPSAAELDAWNKALAGGGTPPAKAEPPAPAEKAVPAAKPTAPDANVSDGTSMIRYYPRTPVEVRMLGGVFEGTNGDPNTGPYTVIHTIAATPVNGWNEVKVDLGTWRYLRYRAPANSNCNVNEIEFYRNGKKLVGTAFGTAGSAQNDGNTFDKVFDGNTSTFFDAPTPDGAYVGIDTGAPGAAAMPAAAKPAVQSAAAVVGRDDELIRHV